MINNFFPLYIKIREASGIKLVNETKFVQVVQFWFDYLNYINDFILHKNKDIDLLNNSLIRKSILYALDILEEKENISIPNENELKQIIIGSFSFGKTGYLPAGVSNRISDKIKFKLLLNKISSLKIKIDQDFKKAFYDACSIHFDLKTVKVLEQIVPDIFFSTGLASSTGLPCILKGSPLSFFDYHYNYLKLLLQSIEIKIVGVQHGGVYGEWKDNPYEKFEEKISDTYYGWGFFDNNIVQNRFKKNLKQVGDRDCIFWFGRNDFYVSKNVDFGNEYGEHNQDVNHIEFFYNFFKKLDFKFLPHPRLSHLIYKKIIEESRYVYTNDSIQFIANAKLIIFDCLSHTLMYYCLFNKIPFVIVIDKWPITGLSSSAMEFYNELFNNGLLLFKDDIAISEKLHLLNEKLNSNQSVFYAKDLSKYIDKKFFLHKTINLI